MHTVAVRLWLLPLLQLLVTILPLRTVEESSSCSSGASHGMSVGAHAAAGAGAAAVVSTPEGSTDLAADDIGETPVEPIQRFPPPPTLLLNTVASLLKWCWPGTRAGEQAGCGPNWVVSAVQLALATLSHVSECAQQQQHSADGEGGCAGAVKAPPAPPAAARQLGLSALDLILAVCKAAAEQRLMPDAYFSMGAAGSAERERDHTRTVLDHASMLPGLIAVATALVFGQQMHLRLDKRAGSSGSSSGGYPRSDSAGGGNAAVDTAAASNSAAVDTAAASDSADADTVAARDQSSTKQQPGNSGGSKSCYQVQIRATQPGSDTEQQAEPPTTAATAAAWEVVCTAKDWSVGQLLPEPLQLLLQAIGCQPRGFLWMACLWWQQLGQQQQQPV